MIDAVYEGEFGLELAAFMPYVHALQNSGTLRSVTTYKGMEALYESWLRVPLRFHAHQHRRHVDASVRTFLPLGMRTEEAAFGGALAHTHTAGSDPDTLRLDIQHARHAHSAYYTHPPLLDDPTTPKDIALVCNKWNVEWGSGHYNFLDGDDLRAIFATLHKTHSTILYVRSDRLRGPGYSNDHDEAHPLYHGPDPPGEREALTDWAGIVTELRCESTDFNRVKLELLRRANVTITALGGANHLHAYFPHAKHIMVVRFVPPDPSPNPKPSLVCKAYYDAMYTTLGKTTTDVKWATTRSDIVRHLTSP